MIWPVRFAGSRLSSGIVVAMAPAVLLAAAALPARAAEKYALVVGVERYDPSELAPLSYAEDDAEAIGAALEKLGFSVVTMTSRSEVAARRPVLRDDILAQVDRRLAEREKADTVVLAFSGHGVQLKTDRPDATGAKELYFCPERARPGDPRTLVPMSEVMRRLERCAAGRKLLLVDACRNEFEPPNGSKSGRVIELPAAGVKRPPIPAGMVAVFSCRPGEQSFEIAALGHSIFSHHVIEFLEGNAPADRYPRGEVGITELASYVRTRTRDTADVRLDHVQVPDVKLPDGSFGEWPLGTLGGGRRPATGDLASVDRKPAMTQPVPKPAPTPSPAPSPTPKPVPPVAGGNTATVENSLGMKLVRIEAGEFLMGSEEGDDEKPIHKVKISKPFLMGQTEVTQGQFQQVMGTTPWRDKSNVKEGGNVAASYVSWDDADDFTRKLTESERRAGRLTGSRYYRLPTEAEWEYACRAGTKTKWAFGDDERLLGDYAWFRGNAADAGEHYAHEVGVKKPNPWGLHDLHGNVREWCSDWHDSRYYKTFDANSLAISPKGPYSNNRDRVLRGGSWRGFPDGCRSACRFSGGTPADRDSLIGFRVVCELE